MHEVLGLKGQSFQGHGGTNMLENALLALLIQYLKNYRTEFLHFHCWCTLGQGWTCSV